MEAQPYIWLRLLLSRVPSANAFQIGPSEAFPNPRAWIEISSWCLLNARLSYFLIYLKYLMPRCLNQYHGWLSMSRHLGSLPNVSTKNFIAITPFLAMSYMTTIYFHLLAPIPLFLNSYTVWEAAALLIFGAGDQRLFLLSRASSTSLDVGCPPCHNEDLICSGLSIRVKSMSAIIASPGFGSTPVGIVSELLLTGCEPTKPNPTMRLFSSNGLACSRHLNFISSSNIYALSSIAIASSRTMFFHSFTQLLHLSSRRHEQFVYCLTSRIEPLSSLW